MKLPKLLVLSFMALALYNCQPAEDEQLARLATMMSGSFSSAEQAQADSAFFDISLEMHPIWTEDQSAKWLYVEQAVSKNLDKPYRQRIYKITRAGEDLFESAVFELPEPEKFIHAWEQEELFAGLIPDSLTVREGCSVFLQMKGEELFEGATPEKECLSTLYGAAYASSEVSVSPGQIVSWDRGWSDAGEQVWGAEKGGYIFKKKM